MVGCTKESGIMIRDLATAICNGPMEASTKAPTSMEYVKDSDP